MTLQEKYNAINEGTFSKQQFLRDARLAFPQIISQFNSYEDASKILKNRSVIAEVEKKPEPIKFDPADNIASDVLDQGIKAELEKKGLPVNQTPSKEEYLAAKKKAVKNLSKDILFYKNVKTMAVSKSDQMQKSKVQVSENTIKALAELINEAKLAEEMTVSGKLQDILDAETPKVAQGAAIALDALKKFYASAENLTKKLEKAYKITGPFMAPALAAAVVDQINGIVTKPYKAEMPKAKMVNIAKINDFETLSKETGISVDDLKAMQKQLKQGTVALPTANEAEIAEKDYSALNEWKKLINENSEGYFVNGKEVDYYSIEFVKDLDSQGYPVMYADKDDPPRFKDGTILDDSEIEVLNSQYFENNFIDFADFYDEDEFSDR
jgi:hypothetical protein